MRLLPSFLLVAFSLFSCDAPTTDSWTEAEKKHFKKRLIKSTNYLQSINRDTAEIIATCFVERIAKVYGVQDLNKRLFEPNKDSSNALIDSLIEECITPLMGNQIK